MTFWTPQPVWQGQEAYVIGGGPSLRDFDWTLLYDRNVIGCNSAILLGACVCDFVVYGDVSWYDTVGAKHAQAYRRAHGRIVGVPPEECATTPPGVLRLHREQTGVGTVDRLAWNGNTGSLGINLALILGARVVYLLGFDMKRQAEKTHWHDEQQDVVGPLAYRRFIGMMKWMVQRRADRPSPLERHFPEARIVNVNDDSDLPWFPRVGIAEHFGEKHGAQGHNP